MGHTGSKSAFNTLRNVEEKLINKIENDIIEIDNISELNNSVSRLIKRIIDNDNLEDYKKIRRCKELDNKTKKILGILCDQDNICWLNKTMITLIIDKLNSGKCKYSSLLGKFYLEKIIFLDDEISNNTKGLLCMMKNNKYVREWIHDRTCTIDNNCERIICKRKINEIISNKILTGFEYCEVILDKRCLSKYFNLVC